MLATRANFNLLCKQGRWKVEFFLPVEDNGKVNLVCNELVPLRFLMIERKETVVPSSLGNIEVNYVGLEHIRAFTGELVEFRPRLATSIKSRSKVFLTEDVLYGRLRPNLNKVWLTRGDVSEGICSTEFFVLVPIKERIRPAVLRYLLSSHYVQRHAVRLQTGTALPRMNLTDLLNIKVPLPDLDTQKALEQKLLSDFDKLVTLRAQVEEMPKRILNDFLKYIES